MGYFSIPFPLALRSFERRQVGVTVLIYTSSLLRALHLPTVASKRTFCPMHTGPTISLKYIGWCPNLSENLNLA